MGRVRGNAQPELAGHARRLFDGGRHKTIATLRADGSPRISGIECEFVDGQLRFGSMANARKGADLRRDPRFALTARRSIPSRATRPSGRARPRSPGGPSPTGAIVDGPDGETFDTDITEVVVTHLNPEGTPAGDRVLDPAAAVCAASQRRVALRSRRSPRRWPRRRRGRRCRRRSTGTSSRRRRR